MSKYGRGLNKEIYLAVKSGELPEVFSMNDIKVLILNRGWNVPDTYINVCLANGASEEHSPTYKKYFKALGNGDYSIQ